MNFPLIEAVEKKHRLLISSVHLTLYYQVCGLAHTEVKSKLAYLKADVFLTHATWVVFFFKRSLGSKSGMNLLELCKSGRRQSVINRANMRSLTGELRDIFFHFVVKISAGSQKQSNFCGAVLLTGRTSRNFYIWAALQGLRSFEDSSHSGSSLWEVEADILAHLSHVPWILFFPWCAK